MNEAPAKILLVIDDEVDLQEMVKLILESQGYQVETASNGIEGLERLKTMSPHLIILDLNMPKMGGIEFYQRICDDANHPKHPVLVLTARAHMEPLCNELKVDGFLTKPFELEHLLAEVSAIMHKHPVVPN